MAQSPNPQSEILREPNLLIPGKKPVGPVKIDWGHPLADGLVLADLSDKRDRSINNRSITLTDVGTAYGAAGRVYTCVNKGDYITTSGFSGTLNGVTCLSVCARDRTISGNEIAVVVQSSFTSGNGLQFQLGNGFGAVADDDKPRLAQATGSGHKMFIDGIKQSSPNPADIDLVNGKFYAIAVAATYPEGWGGHTRLGRGSFDNCPVRIASFFQWDRVLSDADCQSLTADPYQFLIPA